MDGTADGYRHGDHHDDIHLVDVHAQDGERCRHRGERRSIAGSLWLVRNQEPVYDVSYMKAIDLASFGCDRDQRTCSSPRGESWRTALSKPRLAKSQMKSLITDLEAHPVPNDAPDLLSFRQCGAPPE
jgi:hypothetical protein